MVYFDENIYFSPWYTEVSMINDERSLLVRSFKAQFKDKRNVPSFEDNAKWKYLLTNYIKDVLFYAIIAMYEFKSSVWKSKNLKFVKYSKVLS